MSDECDCGTCELDCCDICDGPVAFVDDFCEAWCRTCWDEAEQRRNEAAAEDEARRWHGGDSWPFYPFRTEV